MPSGAGGGSFSGGNAVANTGGGGGGSYSSQNGGNGGSGIVIVRYPIRSNLGAGKTEASMEYYQGLSAGNHDLKTDNGQGTMNLQIVDQDGRKWAKIPYSDTTSGGTSNSYFQTNWLFSQHSFGNHTGEMCWDSSRRWGNYGYEENGYNINTIS